MTSPALSKDELRGLATIARTRQEHLITMFSGARIVYGTPAKATAGIGLPGWTSRVEELEKRRLDRLVDTTTQQISHARVTMAGVKTGEGIVESKGIGGKLRSPSVANARCQFTRPVRVRLPFG